MDTRPEGTVHLAGPRLRPRAAAVLVAALAGAAAALSGIVVSAESGLDPWWMWLSVQLVGVCFTSAGIVSWLRYPESGIGPLMIAVGITWYIVDLRYSQQPVLFAVGFSCFYLSSVIFTHLVLALPTGRLPRGPERLVAVALYVWAMGTQTLRYFVEKPDPPQSWASAGPGASIWGPIASVGGFALASVALWLVVRRWRRASGPARLAHTLVWVAGALVGIVVLVTSLASIFDASVGAHQALGLVYTLGLSLTPFGIMVGLLRVRMARGRVADLIMRLQTAAQPRHLVRALADALGDPSLEVLFRLPGSGGYVDADGHRAVIPDGDDRVLTVVERHGEELAVLVHDPSLGSQRRLVDAVVAAAGLALENARLLAAQRAQLEEVRASRARILAATDLERDRIQRDLHDGIQPRLLGLSILASRALEELASWETPSGLRAVLDRLGAQIRDVSVELRVLTEGIHPPALTEQGLAAVVETLAERAPVPVAVDVARRRWPDQVEQTAYYVINEALANVYRHSGASQAAVRVHCAGHLLCVEVADDGNGGADPTLGTGLSGLGDRVAALGGSFEIRSRPGAGTRIRVRLPCR